jgi:HAD superfamily hydrolase (TIGR01490 family)
MDKVNMYKEKFNREYINRAYYKNYSGASESELWLSGKEWWDKIKKGDIFNEKVLSQFYQHKNNGVKTVLVSGSMKYCIDPLGKELGVDHIICTELEVKQGIVTGEIIGEPNIDSGKANKIKQFLLNEKCESDLVNSYAYGDHFSDLPMLKLVGYSYFVVNGTPVILST